MATPVIMPRQGQSVESCIIIEWKKQIGESVNEGDTLCDVETDKATLEVPSPVSGTLLAQLYAAGDEVPVLETIAVIGEAGEDIAAISGATGGNVVSPEEPAAESAPIQASVGTVGASAASGTGTSASGAASGGAGVGISPRARNLAERKGVDASALPGTGPEGRIIERDVQAALSAQPRLTPVAKAMIADGGYTAPAQGTGVGGRVTSRDLQPVGSAPASAAVAQTESAPVIQTASAPAAQAATSAASAAVAAQAPKVTEEDTVTPLKGVRKVIAERMLNSLQSTAQLTLSAWADARAIQAYRKRLKESPEALGMQGITINDLVLYAVARSLTQHPELNATLVENAITQYKRVHLGMAVDTPRGLVVPVVRNADLLSLREISAEGKRLAQAAIAGKSAPDDLSGGTFTVSNLGAFGVETFTPVLNVPQVAILGVGGISLRAVEAGSGVEFIPHMSLSLTINHQVVDGAPGARFLQTLARIIGSIDLVLAG